jgi:pilin isopeptide linkage protein
MNKLIKHNKKIKKRVIGVGTAFVLLAGGLTGLASAEDDADTYDAHNGKCARVNFEVDVEFDGELPDEETYFTVVCDNQEDAPAPAFDEVKIPGEGMEEFGTIEFTEPGEYIYKIYELDEGIEPYIYDDTVYTIDVDVDYDNKGQLYATYAAFSGDVKESAIMFINMLDDDYLIEESPTPEEPEPSGTEITPEEPEPSEPVPETPSEEPKPSEKVVEAPTEEPKPSEKVVETPTEEPKPSEKVIKTPTEEPKPSEEVVETPSEEPRPSEEVKSTPIPNDTSVSDVPTPGDTSITDTIPVPTDETKPSEVVTPSEKPVSPELTPNPTEATSNGSSPVPTSNKSSTITTPKTGDDTNNIPWVVLLLVGFTGAGACLWYLNIKNKRNQSEEEEEQ